MADIPLDVAHLIGLVIGMCLYGLFLSLFTTAIRALWARRARARFVISITFGLFAATTASIVTSITFEYNAFIKFRETSGTLDYLNETWFPFGPLENFNLSCGIVMADVLLCWRLYFIWSRNRYVIAFPAFLIIIEAVASIILLGMSFKTSFQASTGVHPSAMIVEVVAGTCAVLVNLIVTPLIAGRLWWMSRQTPMIDADHFYRTIISRVIESGGLYTTMLLVWVVYLVIPGYSGIYVLVSYIFAMVLGIAPLLIILHLAKNRPSEMRDIGGTSSAQRQRRVREVISTKIEFNLESSLYSGEAVSGNVPLDFEAHTGSVPADDPEAQRPTVRFTEQPTVLPTVRQSL